MHMSRIAKTPVITCKKGNNRRKEKDYTVVPDYTRAFFVPDYMV